MIVAAHQPLQKQCSSVCGHVYYWPLRWKWPLTQTSGPGRVASDSDPLQGLPGSCSECAPGGPSPGTARTSWNVTLAPDVQVSRTGEHIIDSLYHEHNTLWLCLPDIIPGLLQRSFPPRLCPLLTQAHHPTGPHLLFAYTDLLQDQMAPVLAAYRGCGMNPIPARPPATVPTSTLCLSRLAATSNPSFTLHFLPVRTSMPANDTLESLEPR